MKKEKQVIEGIVYHYRYIDHGAQYRVYAILTADGSETGRVVKVPISFEESRRVLTPHLAHENLSAKAVDQVVHELMIQKQQLSGLIQGMLATDHELMRLLGDLKLVPTLTEAPKNSPDYFLPFYFTQNYVVPMSQFMHTFRFMRARAHTASLDDARNAKRLLRAIIRLHYRLWEYGVFDLTFKLENIGIEMRGNTVGRAILIDGAEHTFSLADAEKALAERKWRHCMDPQKTDHLFLPMVLHEEFVSAFDTAFTAEELHKRWQKKSRAIERRAARKLKLRQLLTINAKKGLMLWMDRQSLKADLHRGIPEERIDGTRIPYGDLVQLLQDTRVGRIPADEYMRQEQAERTMFVDDAFGVELYRYMFRPTKNDSE
jgi:hypothetical protein